MSEAQLYRWGDNNHKEEPVDDDNHALGAMRYLIAILDLDARFGHLFKAAAAKRPITAPPAKPRPTTPTNNDERIYF